MAISDKLQELLDIKQDIKVAIKNKDVDMTGVAFAGYAGKIDELPAVVELTQAQYDALDTTDLIWGLPEIVTGTCSSVGYNPIGTACSLEGDKMIVSGEDLGITSQVTINPYYQEWLISEEDDNITWSNIDSIVDYPPYQPEQGEEEVYVGLLSQSGQYFNYQSTTLHNQIKNKVSSNIDGFQGLSGSGVAYVKLQTNWDDGQSTFYEKGVAFIVPFTWAKDPCYELTCQPSSVDDNTYYLIVEEE
jgi:hypothetical protein